MSATVIEESGLSSLVAYAHRFGVAWAFQVSRRWLARSA
jgi:hypothetical protein